MPFNSIFSWLIKKRLHQIELFKKYPLEVQDEILEKLVSSSIDTYFGKKHGFNKINSYHEFKNKIPLQTYETIKPHIDQLIKGKQNILWNSNTKWFAKSSGTTSTKSKFIPVTKESLEECHYRGGKDLLALYYSNFPSRKLYNGKHLVVGGSTEKNKLSKSSYFGDLSAIIVDNLPWWAEIKRTPSKEITLLNDWEIKIEKMAQTVIKEDVFIIVGVPSWVLVLSYRILEITGKKNLREVWPNLELYMHGGINFEPYKEEFNKLIPFEDMHYVESYNASEGFFAIQDNPFSNDLLLMLDYGIYYEFIPMSTFNGIHSKNVISLSEVKTGINYALVISTNGGLWRYIIGDTIQFTSTNPYKIKVTGRTRNYINSFGEELIVDNAENAMAYACKKTNSSVREYSACPIFMDDNKKGGHQWLIEFINKPENLSDFTFILDDKLQKLNSDYQAKRYKNLILKMPTIKIAKKDTFNKWLKSKGKLGGQNKIPRLLNNREIMDQLLQIQ